MLTMAGYTKLFHSILASTIWLANDKTRIVWITLLAMADKNGIAEGSVPGIASFARVSLKDCQRALTELQAPDEHSRTPDHDGRRIAPVDGGFQILNHAKYRAKLSEDQRREYLREKQRRYRERQRAGVTDTLPGVTNVSDPSTLYTQAKADTDPEEKVQEHKERAPVAESLLPKPADKPTPLPLYVFPTVGHSHEWLLLPDQVDDWQRLFPNLDILAECGHALAWVQANPTKRKTCRGMPKFLVAWLTRATDNPRAARLVRSAAAPVDWFAQCRDLHGGICAGQYAHSIRMDTDAAKVTT